MTGRRDEVDADLYERWRAGDGDAGRRIFERHYPSVARMFRNKVGDALEDLVQRTFLACLEHRPADPGRLRAYLLTTARNELYLHFRERYGPRGRIDPMRTSVHELAPSPSHELRHRDERQQLLEALRRLPLDLQVVLELHYWEGLRGPELAEVLEIPEGTVRSRLRLGRDRLRRCLAELEGQRRASADAGDAHPDLAADFEAWADALRERAGPGVESTD